MNTGSDIKEVPTTQEGETPSSVGNNLHRGSNGLRLKQSCCFGLAGRWRAWRGKAKDPEKRQVEREGKS